MLLMEIKKRLGHFAVSLLLSFSTVQWANAAPSEQEEVHEITIIAVELFGQLAAAADYCEIPLSATFLSSLDDSFKQHSQSPQDYKEMQQRFKDSRQSILNDFKQGEMELDCEQVQQAVDAEEAN